MSQCGAFDTARATAACLRSAVDSGVITLRAHLGAFMPWDKPAVPAIAELLTSFMLDQGKLRMPVVAFQAWLKRHQSLSSQEKALRAQELIGQAVRLQREAGAAAASGVAQLYLLAADLLKSKAFTPRNS